MTELVDEVVGIRSGEKRLINMCTDQEMDREVAVNMLGVSV